MCCEEQDANYLAELIPTQIVIELIVAIHILLLAWFPTHSWNIGYSESEVK